MWSFQWQELSFHLITSEVMLSYLRKGSLFSVLHLQTWHLHKRVFEMRVPWVQPTVLTRWRKKDDVCKTAGREDFVNLFSSVLLELRFVDVQIETPLDWDFQQFLLPICNFKPEAAWVVLRESLQSTNVFPRGDCPFSEQQRAHQCLFWVQASLGCHIKFF